MASQKVYASYQEVIDLHTEANHCTAIGIHTPVGDTPRKMFKGYFDQYKKYKYLGASVTLVPAARLPADPMGVRYSSSGEVLNTYMDPRDALNPIMFHGCHGDDMGSILNTLYGNDNVISDSVNGLDGGADNLFDIEGAALWSNMERLYYKALTDKSWKKANPMSGFKKGNLRPLVYTLATNRQLMPVINDDDVEYNTLTEGGDPTTDIKEIPDSDRFYMDKKNNLQFFTPRLTSLGWMDTRNVVAYGLQSFHEVDSVDDVPAAIANLLDQAITEVELPKIYMGMILLAPAYGVEQYYRMIINHRFAFKQFRGISFQPAVDGVPAYTNANVDLFDGSQYEPYEFDDGSSPVTPPVTPTGSVVVTYPSNFTSSVSDYIRSSNYVLGFGLTDIDGGGPLAEVHLDNMQYANWGSLWYPFTQIVDDIPAGHRVFVEVIYNDGTDNHVLRSDRFVGVVADQQTVLTLDGVWNQV